MLVDLHVHTTASGGLWAPRDVYSYVRGHGIGLFSITDHDLPKTLHVPADLKERYLPGIEVETQLDDRVVHLLLYGHLHTRSHLVSQLARQRKRRLNRVLEMVLKLIEQGVASTLGDIVLASILRAASPGRFHVANALVRLGAAKSINDAFDRYLAKGRVCYIPLWRIPVTDFIEMGHCAGGFVVVAHPMLLDRTEDLDALRKLGIDGVEAWHPSATRTESRRLERFAFRHSLLVTAGSDGGGGRAVPLPVALGEKEAKSLLERSRLSFVPTLFAGK